MNDQDRSAGLPDFDRLLHLPAVARKGPARVSSGSDDQVMGLGCHIRGEGGTQFGDLIDDLLAGGLGGGAGEGKDATVEFDFLRIQRAVDGDATDKTMKNIHRLIHPLTAGEGRVGSGVGMVNASH